MYQSLGKATFENDANKMRPLLRYENDVQSRQNAFAAMPSCYLALPGLVGYWPMSHASATGDILDLGSNNLTLTNNNAAYIYNNNTWTASTRFVGASSMYLSRADEAVLDITGAEGHIDGVSRGLTIGGWFYAVSLPSATNWMTAKYNTTGNQRSYGLYLNSSNTFTFIISSDGTAVYSVSATAAASTSTWYFVVGRYIKATPEINIWIYETEAINTTSIPSSIYSGSATFTIGASAVPDGYYTGLAAHVFLCCTAVPDVLIKAIYRKTKGLFGL